MKKSKVKSIKPVKAFAMVHEKYGLQSWAMSTNNFKDFLRDAVNTKLQYKRHKDYDEYVKEFKIIPVLISPLKARKERKE